MERPCTENALDSRLWGNTLNIMNPIRNQTGTFPRLTGRRCPAGLVTTLASGLLASMLAVPLRAAPGGQQQSPVLQFIEPTNGAVFSTRDTIPIVLRAFATNDVFLTAEVFANQSKIAAVAYCCAACDCPVPPPGHETILRFPVFSNESQLWEGWTNVQAGNYRLTARATGQSGSLVEAVPVNVTVIDRTLEIHVTPDGMVTLRIPEGSLVAGGYDLEASQDLRTWMRLGPFEPGNVAAFYFDVPPESARHHRFYRSVFVPPRVP